MAEPFDYFDLYGRQTSPTAGLGPSRLQNTGSVHDAIAARDRGGTRMSGMTDARTGKRLSVLEANRRGPFRSAGWDTSGVGPGTEGYRGSGRIGSAAGAVGSKGIPTSQRGKFERAMRGDNQSTGFGGLNEFYRNQQTLGEWDRLQGQKAMDDADAISSNLATQQRRALAAGDFASAAEFADALAERSATQMNATGMSVRQNPDGSVSGMPSWEEGPMAPPSGPAYHSPGETRQDAQGNTWRWNERLGRGEMIRSMANDARALAGPDSPMETWVEGDNLGEGTLYTPYGTTSVMQSEMPTTMTNAQGSALGGNMFTGRVAGREMMQNADDFFQAAADRQGIPNRFAKPGMGYRGGPQDSSSSLADYAKRLMSTKQKLKG